MKILALEFSSPLRSVAVVTTRDDGELISCSEVVEAGPTPMGPLQSVEQALRESRVEREQIECVAVGLGPGSYTGIRAAIALAQGWQLARGVRLIGVGSVECMARQTQAEKIFGRVNFIVDAQRNELYLASYQIEETNVREIEPLRLASFDEGRQRIGAGEIVLGPEVDRLLGGGRVMFPRAAALGHAAAKARNFVSGEHLAPIYLREVSFVKAPLPRPLPA